MEFGIFVQGHAPGQAKAHSRVYEQDWVRREIELVRQADKHNWKYVWVTEHHFLEEYSHISDSATFIAYALALTEQIHIGSGIFNINPVVNHPLRLAERVERYQTVGCDQLVFGVPGNLPHDIVMESIRCFGEHVIPRFDTDPVHRTTRQREAAGGQLVPTD